jgi:hypothetical protein
MNITPDCGAKEVKIDSKFCKIGSLISLKQSESRPINANCVHYMDYKKTKFCHAIKFSV